MPDQSAAIGTEARAPHARGDQPRRRAEERGVDEGAHPQPLERRVGGPREERADASALFRRGEARLQRGGDEGRVDVDVAADAEDGDFAVGEGEAAQEEGPRGHGGDGEVRVGEGFEAQGEAGFEGEGGGVVAEEEDWRGHGLGFVSWGGGGVRFVCG